MSQQPFSQADQDNETVNRTPAARSARVRIWGVSSHHILGLMKSEEKMFPRKRQKSTSRILSTEDLMRQSDPWFYSHYISAVETIDSFISPDMLSLRGADVADIGCGDGIIDLGIVNRLHPRRLIGFDLRPVDLEHLEKRSGTLLKKKELPKDLEFALCLEREIPAEDNSFDWVISWSAFEHIADPQAVLQEIRRILRPEGFLFIQLYPFYHSAWGSHLEEWFSAPYVQHRLSHDQIREHLSSNPIQNNSEHGDSMYEAFRTLNRITLDDLHAYLEESGFLIRKAELITGAQHIPEESLGLPLSALLISGVKLLATPKP